MSYRELRAFTETLRYLRYPNVVSIDGLRTSNFPLVAQILSWLMKSYDPHCDEIIRNPKFSNDEEKVHFVAAVVQYLSNSAHLYLNAKRLFAADASSVRDLLLIINLLVSGQKILENGVSPDISSSTIPKSQDAQNIQNIAKAAKETALDITTRGASIYDLLAKEVENRELRKVAIAKNIDLPSAERAIMEAANSLNVEADATKGLLKSMEADSTQLKGKIERRMAELDRREKRLQTLQSVRPAYMDEFERHEVELKKLYKSYVDKIRNLAFLEQHVDEFSLAEHYKNEESESSMKRMQQKLKDEEIRLLRGDADGGSYYGTKPMQLYDASNLNEAATKTGNKMLSRPKAAMSGRRSHGTGHKKNNSKYDERDSRESGRGGGNESNSSILDSEIDINDDDYISKFQMSRQYEQKDDESASEDDFSEVLRTNFSSDEDKDGDDDDEDEDVDESNEDEDSNESDFDSKKFSKGSKKPSSIKNTFASKSGKDLLNEIQNPDSDDDEDSDSATENNQSEKTCESIIADDESSQWKPGFQNKASKNFTGGFSKMATGASKKNAFELDKKNEKGKNTDPQKEISSREAQKKSKNDDLMKEFEGFDDEIPATNSIFFDGESDENSEQFDNKNRKYTVKNGGMDDNVDDDEENEAYSADDDNSDEDDDDDALFGQDDINDEDLDAIYNRKSEKKMSAAIKKSVTKGLDDSAEDDF